MSDLPRNAFGLNLPLDEPSEVVELLGIRPGDRVLEVGGAGNPLPRADVVCDLTFASAAQRNGAPAGLREGVTWVEAPAEDLPFPDDAFDFVWCTHVLEHVRDPEAACRELSRVARRGLVEVPSRLGELLNGNPSHRWIVDRAGDELVFVPRPYVEHPLENLFYGLLFRDGQVRRIAERGYRNLFNHQVLFEGTLRGRVEQATCTVFDYDDPLQAGRAHYSFALNTLRHGADPSYGLPDALEATRLLPESEPARQLVALYRLRLLQPARARAALEGLGGAPADVLRGLADDLESGRRIDLSALPLPATDPLPSGARTGQAIRPAVSVVVAGCDSGRLRAAAESALTQDYPLTSVIVAGACSEADLEAAFEGLRMPDRLRLVALGPDASLGACLNRGCLESRAALVAFLLAGDRWLPHHLDRLVPVLGESSGVHGDRLLVSGEGVVGPDILPDDPATAGAGLSTLVARREALQACGGFDEQAAGDDAILAWIVRLARRAPLRHVREATVESSGPLPSGAAALDILRSGSATDPHELMRHLMAAHSREEGLRTRLRELEAGRGRTRKQDRS